MQYEQQCSAFDLPLIEQIFTTHSRPQLIQHCRFVDGIDSTNAQLCREAVASGPAGLADFTVLAAASQSAGSGRSSRVWHSPEGSSLAVSFALQPGGEELSWASLLVAGCAVEVARKYGIAASVKWPNDVVVTADAYGGDDTGNGPAPTRKLGGVLAQLVAPGAVVVGIGLNILAAPQLPPAAGGPSDTGAADAASAGERYTPTTPGCWQDFSSQELDRSTILAELILAVDECYRQWCQARALGRGGQFAQRKIAALLSTTGRKVRVFPASGPAFTALAVALAPSGELEVEYQGQRQLINTADITHLRPLA